MCVRYPLLVAALAASSTAVADQSRSNGRDPTLMGVSLEAPCATLHQTVTAAGFAPAPARTTGDMRITEFARGSAQGPAKSVRTVCDTDDAVRAVEVAYEGDDAALDGVTAALKAQFGNGNDGQWKVSDWHILPSGMARGLTMIYIHLAPTAAERAALDKWQAAQQESAVAGAEPVVAKP